MFTSDGYVCFFGDNVFSDNIFLKFHSTKRRNKKLKLCEKKDRSPYSFRRKQSLIYLANLFSKQNLLVLTVLAPVRALMTQDIMCRSDAQCNTKESQQECKKVSLTDLHYASYYMRYTMDIKGKLSN